MPLFGAHMSVAGGLTNAVAASVALECGTVQLFTKNANTWAGKPLQAVEVRAFRDAVRAAGLRFPTAHDSYLINLASPDDALYRKSIAAFADEVERAEALGLSYLVTHPGAHVGSGVDAGVARVVAALDEVHARCGGYQVKVLVETTAGQGSCLGAAFEEIATILGGVAAPERLGVCFDTCHAFAAGYPLASADDYAATFGRFDDLVGLDRLRLFHVNDSVKGLGSRVDRHAHLGQGMIGIDAFRRLATDPRFADRPMILETPKEDADGRAMDPVNLGLLRGFLTAPAAVESAPRNKSGRRVKTKPAAADE
ncbi:MAG: deoxyribonuclease IV [Gemmataceae bacterium]|nr:deoxyribonuclease IV [Gemmataceae bacterium]